MIIKCCSARMVLIVTILSALMLAGSLLLCFWGMQKIIEDQVHKQTKLSEGTDQYDRFLELPFPLNYSIRFFIVTNPYEVVHNGEVPNLKETEPYKYSMTIKKMDPRRDDADEDSVTYYRNFNFDFDYSGTTRLEDNITIINPLLMVSLQLTKGIERIVYAGCIDKLLGSAGLNTIITTQPAKKLLFDGINFGFTNETGVACGIVRKRMIEIVKTIRVIEEITDDPSGVEYFRIAFFNYKTINYRKPSPDGIYTVNRGQTNMSALGEIMRWNGGTTISAYGNPKSANNATCDTVKGTDSTIYPPFLEKDKPLIIYNTDICRTVTLPQVSSNVDYRGIKGVYKYETSTNLFRPVTVFPENDCYCSKATKNLQEQEDCYLDGLFDYQPCIGAPAIVSQPHFLNADPKYRQNFPTLKPDKSKHGMNLFIEPNTGTPLKGAKRLQINVVLRKEPLISFITPKTMHEDIVPILWLDESFSIPDKYIHLLNDQYFSKVKLAKSFKYGFVGATAAIFTGSLFIFVRKQFFRKKTV